jgi:cyclopropane fatty-acyl-phospholipid synthase-like methyltransferase
LNRFDFFATIERYHTIQNPISEEKLDLAASYCGIRDGQRVLDVGCGKGWLARRLAKRFDIRITGLEINRVFATEARNLAAAEGLSERIEIVQAPALDFHPEPASYDAVMCIGASFALGGFEPALDWMRRSAKPGGIVAIGEVFANQLPMPADIANMPRYSGCARSLWMTVEAMRSLGLMLRGMVESSRDDWNRYHSLHWQAALDWALANPGQPDIKILTDPTGQRCDLEFDGRCIGWAIFVARNGTD